VDPVPAYTLLELNKFSLVFRVNKMSRFSSNKATLYKSFYVKKLLWQKVVKLTY